MIHYADHLDSKKGEALDAKAVAANPTQVAAPIEKPSSSNVSNAEGEKKLKAMLDGIAAGHNVITDSQLDDYCEGVAKLIGASAVYIAERTGVPTPAGEEVQPGGGARIKYIARSSKDQDFVKASVISEPAGASTLKAWVMPEAAPVEEPVEGEPANPAPPPPELPTVLIQNVLKDSSLTFHGVPRPGSYAVAPIQYGSVIHPAALAEGAAPTTAEDGTVTLPAATPVQRYLALCADTMGSAPSSGALSLGGGAKLTDESVALLKRCANYLKLALERTEAAAFSEEYNRYLAPKGTPEEEASKLTVFASEADAVLAAATEQGNAEVAAAGETAPEDVKTLLKSRAMLSAAKSVLQGRLSNLKAEVQDRLVAPKADVLKLLQNLWYMLGYTKEQLADAGQPDPLTFDWFVARKRLDDEFLAKISQFDAEAETKALSYAKTDLLKAAFAELNVNDLNKTSGVCGALLAWAKACCDVKEAAAAKRAREAAEKKAAEEAAAAAEAAAKEAAAAAAE